MKSPLHCELLDVHSVTSSREVNPWDGRPLPPQFYSVWKNTGSDVTAPLSDPRLQIARYKNEEERGMQTRSSTAKAKTDIFEIVRKRMENANENLISAIKQDKRRLDCILNANT
eukprot:Gregarina_sp_Poly_1__5758@NODE_302_length_9747_cov_161_916736_g261_i0_p8_GENE_NODE_302_length_9747_cov_161_916736_g261_i0NODE_302_length_9747_cov_161_916736_g261_i0_p8_ORF_typecomplete_len114_score15_05_NODE_302_length_9747_cov_161_916736_g261_i041944535